MSKTWLVSDTHFGHAGVTKFLGPDGKTKLRPWDSVEEMDEAMVKLWNEVVKPEDRVWHLGDVVINRKSLPILGRLNGRKKLIMGNHDIFKASEYLEYFEDVKSFHKLDDYALTHIPLHPDSIGRWAKGNIHGHLHANNVMKKPGWIGKKNRDMRYICVCVEQTGFKPIDFDDIVRGRFT
jgi:calcineurin-like phosphoesterase family protein